MKKPRALLQIVTVRLTAGDTGRVPAREHRTVCHLVGEDRAGDEGRAEHSDDKTKEILAQRH